MGRFQAKPLAALEAIYRFVGGLRASGQVDLSAPIVLVHDVSDEAERGGSLVLQISNSATTGGAGAALFSTVDVAAFFDGSLGGIAGNLADLGRRPENTDVYLLRCWVTKAAAAIDFAQAMVSIIAKNDKRYINAVGKAQCALLANTATSFFQTAGGDSELTFVDGAGVEWTSRHMGCRLPAPLEVLQFRTVDDTTGATTVTYTNVIAFVPINTPPPAA